MLQITDFLYFLVDTDLSTRDLISAASVNLQSNVGILTGIIRKALLDGRDTHSKSPESHAVELFPYPSLPRTLYSGIENLANVNWVVVDSIVAWQINVSSAIAAGTLVIVETRAIGWPKLRRTLTAGGRNSFLIRAVIDAGEGYTWCCEGSS